MKTHTHTHSDEHLGMMAHSFVCMVCTVCVCVLSLRDSVWQNTQETRKSRKHEMNLSEPLLTHTYTHSSPPDLVLSPVVLFSQIGARRLALPRLALKRPRGESFSQINWGKCEALMKQYVTFKCVS